MTALDVDTDILNHLDWDTVTPCMGVYIGDECPTPAEGYSCRVCWSCGDVSPWKPRCVACHLALKQWVRSRPKSRCTACKQPAHPDEMKWSPL